MAKTGVRALIFLTYGMLSLILIFNSIKQHIDSSRKSGKLEITANGEDYYYDELHDIRFPGTDINGTTYYFLPSYINNDDIIQTSEAIKVYLKSGELLNRAKFGEI